MMGDNLKGDDSEVVSTLGLNELDVGCDGTDRSLKPNIQVIESTLGDEGGSVDCLEDVSKTGSGKLKLTDDYISEHMENRIKIGCVKWFNIKVGYGFITISDKEREYDLFVHHSAINTQVEIYRYLVQGEYVHFEWNRTNNQKYMFQAVNVSGINGGKLMCETRNESRQNSSSLRLNNRVRNGVSHNNDRTNGRKMSDSHRSSSDMTKEVNMKGERDSSDTNDWTEVRGNNKRGKSVDSALKR